jgi:hypothetical protein
MKDMFTQSKNICAILLTIFMAAACGGGGGGDGITNPSPALTAGITRTGVAVAVGPITGFGSVIVNGVRYDTSAATFTKDGVAAVQSDFSVGQFVVVTGTIDDDNSNAVATTVEFEDLVEGPVASVTGTTFVALGQTVLTGPTTSIDDNCPDLLADLVSVPAVEVSGSFLDDGRIDASRVECKPVLGLMEVTGKVSGLDTGATMFQINALTVNYGGITPRNFPGGAISDGDLVEVKGTNLVTGLPLTLTATDVEFKGPRLGDDEGDHVEVEGFITDFVSATSFTVSPFAVTTDSNTRYEPAGFSASDLGPNLKVEVEGEINDAGLLLATKIDFKQATNIRVTGEVDRFETAGGKTSLFILNIEITTDDSRFEDKFDDPPTNPKVENMDFDDLRVGDYVEVRGQEFPADSGVVDAVILERDDPPAVQGEETELRGFVEPDPTSESRDIIRPNLIVLGVTIRTDDAITEYFDSRGSNEDVSMMPNDFWAEVAVGSLVDADGTEDLASGNAMFAEELELEGD